MLWLMVLQGLNYIFPLVVFPYLGSVLGASGYGKVNFGLSFAQAMVVIIDYGFNLSATKQIAIASNQATIDKVATDTLWAKILLLGVCTVLTLGLMLIPQYAPYRRTVAIMFPILVGSVCSFFWLYQGLGKIRQVSVVNCACRLVLLPFIFWGVRSSEDVLAAAGLLTLTYLLPSVIIVGWTIYKRLFRLVPTCWTNVRRALQDSLPLFLSSATSSVYAILFVVILGYFATPDEVGRYSIAEQIMRATCVLFLFPTVLVFYPQVSKLFKEDRLAARRLVRRILLGLSGVMIVLGIGLFFGGEWLVELLGRDYENTEGIFHIMAFIPMLMVVGGVCGQLGLVACGETRQYRQFRNVYFIAAGVAIVSVGCLSPILDARWLAVCRLGAEAVVGVLMFWYYRKI